MNAQEVKQQLPHRYPMLLLDEVGELSESRAVGWKNVTVNEPYFRGHFPNAPVMPGVLVMESLCQLCWIWVGRRNGARLSQIKKLRFRRTTLPGDRLKLELELVERTDTTLTVKASASVESELALTGQLTFALSS